VIYKNIVSFNKANKNNNLCKSCALKGINFTLEHRQKISIKAKLRIGEKNSFFGKGESIKGEKNGMYGKSVYELWVEKYGIDDAIRKNKQKNKKLSIASSGEKNGFFKKHHTEKSKEKMSESKANLISSGNYKNKNSFGKKGYYFSIKNNENIYYDSMLEKYRMIQLDLMTDIIQWTKKHKIKIKYTINNENHYFVPDFLITYKDKIVLEEIKGYDIKEKYKKMAMKKYCDENNIDFNWIYQYELIGYKKWLNLENKNENEK